MAFALALQEADRHRAAVQPPRVPVPATPPPAPAQHTKMQVAVPPGMGGGMALKVQTPAGLMQVTIPPGLTAGQQFPILVPPAGQNLPVPVPVAKSEALTVPRAQPAVRAPQAVGQGVLMGTAIPMPMHQGVQPLYSGLVPGQQAPHGQQYDAFFR